MVSRLAIPLLSAASSSGVQFEWGRPEFPMTESDLADSGWEVEAAEGMAAAREAGAAAASVKVRASHQSSKTARYSAARYQIELKPLSEYMM